MGGQRRAQLGVNNMDVWQPSDLQFAGEYAVSPETIQPNFTSGLVIGSPPTILTK
jgi:hypothetical protein